jgi:hypothetical protein
VKKITWSAKEHLIEAARRRAASSSPPLSLLSFPTSLIGNPTSLPLCLLRRATQTVNE